MRRQHLMPVIVREIGGREQHLLIRLARSRYSGIVDQHVNRAIGSEKIAEHLPDRCTAGNVGDERSGRTARPLNLSCNILSSFGTNIVDTNPSALTGKQESHFASES